MDLDPRYFTGLDVSETARLVLLLAIVPFAAGGLVSLALGRPDDSKSRLVATWNRLPGLVRRLSVLALLPVALLLAAIIVAQLWLVDDLLAMPWGFVPALMAIALGTTLAVTLTTRPRGRGLRITTGIVLLLTLVVVVVFGSWSSPGDVAPASPQPPAVENPAAPPAEQPSMTPAGGPEPTGGPTDIHSAMIDGAAYAVSREICVTWTGTVPVSIELNSDNTLVARTAGGHEVEGVTVRDLLPCDRVSAGDAELRFAAGQLLRQPKGSLLLTDITPIALAAVVTGADGRDYGLVWRNELGDLYVGLIPFELLTK
jgi:hypothetical protein